MCHIYQWQMLDHTFLLNWLFTMMEEQLTDSQAWYTQDVVHEQEKDHEDHTFQDRHLALEEKHTALLQRLLEAQEQQSLVVLWRPWRTTGYWPLSWLWQSPLCCSLPRLWTLPSLPLGSHPLPNNKSPSRLGLRCSITAVNRAHCPCTHTGSSGNWAPNLGQSLLLASHHVAPEE